MYMLYLFLDDPANIDSTPVFMGMVSTRDEAKQVVKDYTTDKHSKYKFFITATHEVL